MTAHRISQGPRKCHTRRKCNHTHAYDVSPTDAIESVESRRRERTTERPMSPYCFLPLRLREHLNLILVTLTKAFIWTRQVVYARVNAQVHFSHRCYVTGFINAFDHCSVSHTMNV